MLLNLSRASVRFRPIELYSLCSLMSGSNSKKIRVAQALACGCAIVTCTLLFAQRNGRFGQTQEEADRKSSGCVACHGMTDSSSMHSTGTVRLGCTDCHGGHADGQ